ncbi:MAG: class A beta-lactamase [Planctomycetes bacterium]|nr:class A beta-lactamase [Planctomycetota bacterium]
MHPTPLDRRTFVLAVAGAVAAAALASCRAAGGGASGAIDAAAADFERELARLEGGGRLGVALLDTADGTLRGHRLDERFAMCSTFKLALAALVLERAATGGRPLDTRLRVAASDLQSHAPVTRAAVEEAQARGEEAAQLSLEQLAHAAQTTSDNGAANLLLRDVGGPAAFTAFCRAHGDATTRLDRYEPEMNVVRVGDVRDTTTPRAMAQLVARLLGGGLAPAVRRTLRDWMIATTTGLDRVRRGLPPDWVAGDKTGTGGGDGMTVLCNDVVWIEPPGRAPLVVAAYYDTGVVGDWPSDEMQGVLAEVGRLVARTP